MPAPATRSARRAGTEPDAGHAARSRPPGPAPAGEALTADEFSAAVAAVTSAFGDPTRREIYLFARDRTVDAAGVTAGEVAERFALHPNVARHHLEKLAAGGYLTVELSRSEGAGRPSKRYRATGADAVLTIGPRRVDLLGSLLARALELVEPERAAAMADEVGYEYGLALAAGMGAADGQRSVRAAVAAVAEALTAHGFAAHTESRGRALAIVSECCPFGEAAQRHPHVVCAVDRGMIRGMLAGLYGDTQPRFEETRPGGDEHCVTRL